MARAGRSYPVSLLRPHIGRNLGPAPPDSLSGSDFITTGPNLYDLVVRVNAHNQKLVGPADANGPGTYYAILNGTFNTDNQSVQVVLASNLNERFVAFENTTLATTIYMHSDPSHTVGSYCDIFFDRIEIGSYTRSGSTYTKTPFTDGVWIAGGSGADLAGSVAESSLIEFKNFGTLWKVLLNQIEVLTVTSSAVTFDSSRRSGAISIQRETYAGNPKQDSFWLFSIVRSDWLPQTSLGSGAKMARTSATTQAISGGTGGYVVFPTGFFTNTLRFTTDIVSDPNNAKYTVSVEGWYDIKLRFFASINATNGSIDTCVFKNGAMVEHGQRLFFPVASALLATSSSWTAYLMPGDTVQAGIFTDSGTTTLGPGDADGAGCYFNITLMNRSLV